MPACRDGALNVVTGGGATVGQALIDHADVNGVVFTGSKEVGLKLLRENAGRADAAPRDHRDGRQESRRS